MSFFFSSTTNFITLVVISIFLFSSSFFPFVLSFSFSIFFSFVSSVLGTSFSFSIFWMIIFDSLFFCSLFVLDCFTFVSSILLGVTVPTFFISSFSFSLTIFCSFFGFSFPKLVVILLSCGLFLFFSSMFSTFGTFWGSTFWTSFLGGTPVFSVFLFFDWLFMYFSVFNWLDDSSFFGFCSIFIFWLGWIFWSSFIGLEFSIFFFSSIFWFDWIIFLGPWWTLLFILFSICLWFSFVCVLWSVSILFFLSIFGPWCCGIFLFSFVCDFSPISFLSSFLWFLCSILINAFGFCSFISVLFLSSILCSFGTPLLFSITFVSFCSALFIFLFSVFSILFSPLLFP